MGIFRPSHFIVHLGEIKYVGGCDGGDGRGGSGKMRVHLGLKDSHQMKIFK